MNFRRGISPCKLLAGVMMGTLLPTAPGAEYRGPNNRTIYDSWIADSHYQQDAERRAKAWADKSKPAQYKDHAAELSALNQQSRMKAQWEAEEQQMAARRAAREAAYRAREAERRAVEQMYDAARAGDADALMTLGAREETSAFSKWGIPRYQVVFGPRRVAALWRVVELLRAHANEPQSLNAFRPVDSFLTELASFGDAKAAKQLAQLRQAEADYDQAGKYFAQAGASGDREARRAAIMLVAEGRVDAVPVEPGVFSGWCETEAAAGVLAAQWTYGRALSRGEEIPRDSAKALSLLRQAIAQDPARLAPASRSLRAQAAELAGRMLRDGAGVPPDVSSGVKMLEFAATADSVPAMRELGKTFMLGLGVPVDAEQARRWLSRAAERDDASAAYFLSVLCLRPDVTADELAQGLSWLRRAAKRRPEAMLRYGQILFAGEYGVAQDADEAMAYFRLAFERYPRDGQVLDFLGATYLEGSYGASRNVTEGIRILKLAFAQGSVRSAQRLEAVYRLGSGVPIDLVEAQRWQARMQ